MDKASVEYVTLQYGASFCGSYSIDECSVDLFNNNKMAADLMRSTDGQMVRSMIVHILEHSDPKEIRYETPATWFQHLKRDHAPKWFLDRCPVKTILEVVEIKDVYPFPEQKLGKEWGDCIRIAIKKGPYVMGWKDEGEGVS